MRWRRPSSRTNRGVRSLSPSWRIVTVYSVAACAVASALLLRGPSVAPRGQAADHDNSRAVVSGVLAMAAQMPMKTAQPNAQPGGAMAAGTVVVPAPRPDPGAAQQDTLPSLGWPQLALMLVLALGGCLAALTRSIVRRKRLEAELARVQRAHNVAIRTVGERQGLETLGRLAAGVAHDMGNVMQAVELYLRTIPDTLDDKAALQRLLDRAGAAARRGATGARDLLALARGSEGRPERIDVAPLLHELGEVMQDLLGPDYAVRLRIDDDLPAVLAEAGDLEAMLINLATNARDAMAMAGTGALDISAALVGSPDGVESPDDPLGGEWVCIGIADTGIGMDAQTLEKATEPFFTTKPRGRGTGLGLALAREFAERSGGFLRISSTPGTGTRVVLYLHPALDAKERTDGPQRPDATSARRAPVRTADPTVRDEQNHG